MTTTMRNSIFLLIGILLINGTTFGKKVKFAVDMTGIELSPKGIHVTGDFQEAAGFKDGDWQSNTTPLTKEANSMIYSTVVDIPAHRKYEYKFVNGELSYEVEFVPEESRVGYNFNDNRWIYVDSLANDTTFIGALTFGGNAPEGLYLLRLKVDMKTAATLSSQGVHLGGTFRSWNPAQTMMYSFESTIYEYMAFVGVGSHEYRYYNGSSATDAETVPAGCALPNGNRLITIQGDTVLPIVNFSECSTLSSIAEQTESSAMHLFPNPAHSSAMLYLDGNHSYTIMIVDALGRVVRKYPSVESTLEIKKTDLHAGMYSVHIVSDGNIASILKLIFE